MKTKHQVMREPGLITISYLLKLQNHNFKKSLRKKCFFFFNAKIIKIRKNTIFSYVLNMVLHVSVNMRVSVCAFVIVWW